MRKAFIIHGWGGSPQESIHKWLRVQLEKNYFQVQVPEMPNSEKPTINEWVSFLKELVSEPNEETYFIGHSIGCQTILRYLECLPEKTKVGGVVLLAPWLHLLDTAYENQEEESRIARPWLETPIDWEKAKSHSDNFTAIFSDNDFCVPLSDKDIFKDLLNAKIIVEHNKGHFTEETNVTEIPSVLEAIVEMVK